MITIKSSDGKSFWERNDVHPDGEVFIAHDKTAKVTPTTAINTAIKKGRLIVITTKRRRAATPKRKK